MNQPLQEILNLLNRENGLNADLKHELLREVEHANTELAIKNRELEIESSLERVRRRAMAMQKSEDLANAVCIVFEELGKLNLGMLRCGIGILSKEKRSADVWTTTTSEGGSLAQVSGDESMDIHPLLTGAFESWLRREDFTYHLQGEDLNNYYKAVAGTNVKLPESESIIAENEQRNEQYYFMASFQAGGLFAFREAPFPNEAKTVIHRFADVFTLTYTRFIDLQKAEAQAREAQIEVSLERVRSKTMAMHNSHDVGDTVGTMFDELVKLGVVTNRCGILIGDDEQHMEVWTAKSGTSGERLLIIGKLDMRIHPMLLGVNDAWIKREPEFSYEMIGNDLKEYYRAINNLPEYPIQFDLDTLPEKQVHSDFFFPEGALFAFTEEKLQAENVQIFKRFAGVFALTYRRYLDLQKAEIQAKEATIEAALEKVRGLAMAMRTSKDLSSTASMVFTELRKIGIRPIRCGVGLLEKEHRKALLYSSTTSADGDSLSLVGWVMLTGHPVMTNIYESWQRGEIYYPVLEGEQLKTYYENLLSGLSVPSVPDWKSGEKQYGHFLPFTVGCLYAWAEKLYSEEEINILKRFASIIDLTFRRYVELEKSEAMAKEAVRRASLDRVRAETASMRSINDLDRITPLIWNELTTLGVPFIRCGVFIMDDEEQQIHTFLSTPDGKAIAAFHLPFDTPGSIAGVLAGWKKREMYRDHWDEQAFLDWTKNLVKLGAITSPEKYATEHAPKKLDLHFLPFLQGMLYVGTESPMGDEDLHLVHSLADAFSTAYARYEDFNKLEAAKKQTEKTLAELKQAQAQLVQAEKMASLGELTAGIAHEIQNPLNFVNNFSELSNELFKELKEEIEKGNTGEVKLLAEDIGQNLVKINHHGKRADAIVKGMLQHSRASSGQKIATDINALADEYLRLSYHGLRSKDSAFNATMHTDFDQAIGKIDVIPQDIGRVFLNLYNNAFYAVTEKAKTSGGTYKPTITVVTRLNLPAGIPPEDSANAGLPSEAFAKTAPGVKQVEIRIKDNGGGIPQKVLDKIFQPFFTTKPTGSGTGLGLSLSYDIVKAHGGEIKVNTLEGESTEFIISLPLL